MLPNTPMTAKRKTVSRGKGHSISMQRLLFVVDGIER